MPRRPEIETDTSLDDFALGPVLISDVTPRLAGDTESPGGVVRVTAAEVPRAFEVTLDVRVINVDKFPERSHDHAHGHYRNHPVHC